jgi:hypothetical protein
MEVLMKEKSKEVALESKVRVAQKKHRWLGSAHKNCCECGWTCPNVSTGRHDMEYVTEMCKDFYRTHRAHETAEGR